MILYIIFVIIADCPGEENISIILDGIESELKFITDSKGDKVKKKEIVYCNHCLN